MRVGIIQSCYVPWRGYFDFIDSVDLFIFFDDIKYPTGRSWRNRNRFKTRNGPKWLTVPVQANAHTLPIDEVRIATTAKSWVESHRNFLHEAFRQAPFADVALSLWEDGVSGKDVCLSQLNRSLIKSICNYLQIQTPCVSARDYAVGGTKSLRLVNLLRKVGATHYLTGPSAEDYIDESVFRANGITLEYKRYEYPPYPQLWGEFDGTVSVLDLIANVGPSARQHLKSLTADIPLPGPLFR